MKVIDKEWDELIRVRGREKDVCTILAMNANSSGLFQDCSHKDRGCSLHPKCALALNSGLSSLHRSSCPRGVLSVPSLRDSLTTGRRCLRFPGSLLPGTVSTNYDRNDLSGN